jgi:hypothetical protein
MAFASFSSWVNPEPPSAIEMILVFFIDFIPHFMKVPIYLLTQNL